MPTPNALWDVARTENILRHLKNCHHQPEAVKATAIQQLTERGLLKSPQCNHDKFVLSQPVHAPGMGILFHPSLPTGPPNFTHSFPTSSTSSPSPFSSNSNLNSYTGSPTQTPSPSLSLSPLVSGPYSPHLPSPLAFPPSGSLSVASNYSRKCPRYSREISRQQSLSNIPIWTPDNQARLGVSLARITTACGFPYRWVENPEWNKFLAEFLPGAQTISRRQISDTIIPREIAKYRELAKVKSKGCLVTLQCDGWTGMNFHHFLAFMITTDKREVCHQNI